MERTIDVSPADMLLFAAVVREGSFTATARALGLTKQSVSERMARLEQALGVRLLERTTRRMRPTDAGAAYAEHCQSIAALIQDANDAVRQRQSKPMGRLRVACPRLFGRRVLTSVLAPYAERFPAVQPVLTLTDRRVDLLADGFDVAVHVGRPPDSPYTARRIGEGTLYLVASPSYLRRTGKPTVASLAAARCLGQQEREFWRIGEQRVTVAPAVVANDLEALCALAVAGAGIARLPNLACQDALDEGHLVRLFPDVAMSTRPIWVLYAARRHLTAATRHFVDMLADVTAPRRAP